MSKDNEKITVTVDEDIEDLIPEYLENRQTDIEQIEKDLENKEFGNIRIFGHSMKGSGGGYGFDRISEIGEAMECAAEKQNSEEIKKQVAELSDFLAKVEVVYE